MADHSECEQLCRGRRSKGLVRVSAHASFGSGLVAGTQDAPGKLDDAILDTGRKNGSNGGGAGEGEGWGCPHDHGFWGDLPLWGDLPCGMRECVPCAVDGK